MRQMDGGQWQVKSQCVDCCSTMSVSVHPTLQATWARADTKAVIAGMWRH